MVLATIQRVSIAMERLEAKLSPPLFTHELDPVLCMLKLGVHQLLKIPRPALRSTNRSTISQGERSLQTGLQLTDHLQLPCGRTVFINKIFGNSGSYSIITKSKKRYQRAVLPVLNNKSAVFSSPNSCIPLYCKTQNF